MFSIKSLFNTRLKQVIAVVLGFALILVVYVMVSTAKNTRTVDDWVPTRLSDSNREKGSKVAGLEAEGPDSDEEVQAKKVDSNEPDPELAAHPGFVAAMSLGKTTREFTNDLNKASSSSIQPTETIDRLWTYRGSTIRGEQTVVSLVLDGMKLRGVVVQGVKGSGYWRLLPVGVKVRDALRVLIGPMDDQQYKKRCFVWAKNLQNHASKADLPDPTFYVEFFTSKGIAQLWCANMEPLAREETTFDPDKGNIKTLKINSACSWLDSDIRILVARTYVVKDQNQMSSTADSAWSSFYFRGYGGSSPYAALDAPGDEKKGGELYEAFIKAGFQK